MTTTLATSSEMMTNHLQAALVSATGRFEALQTSDGHGVVFSVGTNGALNAIAEGSGATTAGWTVHDLSTATIQRDGPPGATVRTFDVGQSAVDATIGLGMAVGSGDTQQLHLSLGNSDADLAWLDAPEWVAYPFDDPTVTVEKLEIARIYFAEPGAVQYIVVDIVADPSSPVQEVARFVIDPAKAQGHHWHHHALPIEVEVGGHDSVVGRLPQDAVDGIYTAGQVGGSGQLAYVPVVNAFGSGPPQPVRLSMPSDVVPGGVATTRNADTSTDLYVVGGSTLHYWPSTGQRAGSAPVSVLTDDVLAGTTTLAAMAHDGIVTVWGLNGSDEVYSLSCAAGSLAEPSAWSVPLPLVHGAEHLSPYVNRSDGGNTIYTASESTLTRISRSDVNGVWNTDQITLPAPPDQPSISFNSYTSTFFVSDDDDLPAPDVTVTLTGSRRCAAYVNGLYYVVGADPIEVPTTPTGMVTVVEATPSLTGTTFTVSPSGAAPSQVDPMSGPLASLASLDTVDKLTAAQVRAPDGTTHPLVAPGTSRDACSTVANGLGRLASSARAVPTVRAGTPADRLALVTAPAGASSIDLGELGDIGDAIRVAIGDLFRWLESGIEAFVKIVEDAAEGLLHFIAKIGEAVYDAVLDTVEAVVGAAQWLFTAVETAIHDVIAYVSFLFDWDDIRRTKQVFHNLASTYLTGEVAALVTLKSEVDDAIVGVEKTIATWAGMTDWSGLGDAGGKRASGSAANPTAGQTSGSSHLTHHFQNNASSITATGPMPSPDLVEKLVTDLFHALESEAEVLDGVLEQLHDLARDFSSLTVAQVLERLVGILAIGVLGSAKVVIDVVFDILIDVATAALAILDTTIHIPVISDILNAIGIPDLSFLDLFCWIGATAYTVVDKIATGAAPFPDDDDTTFLATASLSDLEQAFSVHATPSGSLSGRATTAADAEHTAPAAVESVIPTLPASVGNAVFIAGHAFGGFCTLMADFVDTFEAAEETGDNEWGIPSAILAILGGGSIGVANVLVPKDPIQNEVVSIAASGTTVIRIASKVVFSGALQKRFAASEGVMKMLAASDGRATGAIVDAILVLPGLACTGWHFHELASDPAGPTRSDAILDEVSNLTSYVSRVAYAVAVNDDDPESKAIEIAVMAVANVATAGLQTAEAIVD